MAGGTLIISRAVKNHEFYKKRFTELGFCDVTVTNNEKDALYFQIRELQPSLVIMSARFYHCSTPFIMGELVKTFPNIKFASVVIGYYPEEFGLAFIANGVKSYVSSFDGVEQFYKGLGEIGKGRDYISPSVVERIETLKEFPPPAGKITERYLQVIRLLCCGFRDNEIADTLHITKGTVENYKSRFFPFLNVRSTVELIRAALTIGFVKLEEIYFFPEGLSIYPKAEKKQKKRRKK